MTLFAESDFVWQQLKAIDNEPTGQFRKLVAAAALDPKTDFRNAYLVDLPLRGADISGFDFSGSDLRGSEIRFAAHFDGLVISDDTTLDEDDRSWWARINAPVQPTDQVAWGVTDVYDDLARGQRLHERLFIMTEILLVGFMVGAVPFMTLLSGNFASTFLVTGVFGLSGVSVLFTMFITVIRLHIDAVTKARILTKMAAAARTSEISGNDIQRLNEAVSMASSPSTVDNIILEYFSRRIRDGQLGRNSAQG